MALLSFHLEPRSGVPYYIQLADQVRHGVHFGLLRSGDQLPTVREVVVEVAVNPNTVLRAYRELEYGGLVVMKPGSGTFVADGAAAAIDQELYGSLRRELERWIDSGRARGVDDETLAALFDHVLHGKQREGVA